MILIAEYIPFNFDQFTLIYYFLRRDSFITHRAFCEALAHESGRHPPTLSTISNHLFGSNHINLGLSQVGSQISLNDHNHPSPNKYDHLLPPSNINPSNSFTHQSPQSPFLIPDSTQQQPYQEHQNSIMPNKPFHGLMQLPDLQSNNNNSPSNLFNLEFFSSTNCSIGNNNNNRNSNVSSSGFIFSDHFNNGNTGSGSQGTSLFTSDHVGSGLSSIYNTQNSTPHMSATALLQKAAQIGSTTSSTGGSLSKMENESQLQGLMDSLANAGSSMYSTEEENGFCGFSESGMRLEQPNINVNADFGKREAARLNRNFGLSIGGSDRLTLDFLGVGGGGEGILRNMGGGFSQSISSFDPKMN